MDKEHVNMIRHVIIYATLHMSIVMWLVPVKLSTVGRIIFEDKKFRGFRGYLVNLENKYPRNFLYIRLDSSFNT